MDAPDDVFKAIIAILILVTLFLPVMAYLSNVLTGQACQPYIQQIQQKDAQIKALNEQIAFLNEKLANLSAEYERLRNENITKADIEDIKQQINVTQLQVKFLEQQFQIVNQNFVHAYNTYYRTYVLSIFINVFLVGYLALDFISATLFDTSIQVIIAKRVKLILGRLHKKRFRKNN